VPPGWSLPNGLDLGREMEGSPDSCMFSFRFTLFFRIPCILEPQRVRINKDGPQLGRVFRQDLKIPPPLLPRTFSSFPPPSAGSSIPPFNFMQKYFCQIIRINSIMLEKSYRLPYSGNRPSLCRTKPPFLPSLF